MNIPNLLTLSRIILIPLFLYLIFTPTIEHRIWALVIFVIASLTDLLDGWTARKLKQETETGKFLDPLADKFLVIAALIAFLFLDPLIPLWMVIVIIARDLLITLMRYLAIKKGTTLKTSRLGKVKTAFQMISIILIIMVFIVRNSIKNYKLEITQLSALKYETVYDIINSNLQHKWLIVCPYCIMAVVTLLTALSGLRYIATNWRLFVPPYAKKD
ncbi:MAG TPA: CDP-diacylglycerol--glycerol-3-phosphate 3-phosphatidyltransferase [Spirochaetota bacterium]|nr:CDP-diacylglycerol--glycerol-3-phosphate 3-phosphatidyltransferase [Spirochaetota bacterium]HQI37445.1 CDP-diacylglycerol--glycerol-3-phosphate 3-phosphatidyltransferase [Spirochaetota bacterium]